MTMSSESNSKGAAVLVDQSARGLLIVRGKDRIDLLQRITTNDVKKLAPGEGNLCCFTTAKGRIVDHCRILAGADATLVVTSAGRAKAVAQWIDRYVITEDVKVADVSDAVAQFELIGEHAAKIAERLDARFAALPMGGHFQTTVGGVKSVTLVRTRGLREHDGVLLIGPRDASLALRDALEIASRSALGAAGELRLLASEPFDALRIDAGIPSFGPDITEENNPLEAGLWNSISFEKGCYVGQEVVARLRTYDKVMKQICRLELPGPSERGTKLFADGREVGTLTSVAGPPHLARSVALGFVNRRVLQAGTPIHLGSADASSVVEKAEAIKLDR